MKQSKAIQFLCKAYHPTTGIMHSLVGRIIMVGTAIAIFTALAVIVFATFITLASYIHKKES